MGDHNESHIEISVRTYRTKEGTYRSDSYIHAHHVNPVVQSEMYHSGSVSAGLTAQGHSNALGNETANRQLSNVYSDSEIRKLKS